MSPLIAAAGGDAAVAFIEIGAVALVLSVLARLAGRLGITAIPLYLLAGPTSTTEVLDRAAAPKAQEGKAPMSAASRP